MSPAGPGAACAEELRGVYRRRLSGQIRAEIRAWRATDSLLPSVVSERAAHLEAAGDVLRERGEQIP